MASKIGPRELALRAQREAEAAKTQVKASRPAKKKPKKKLAPSVEEQDGR